MRPVVLPNSVQNAFAGASLADQVTLAMFSFRKWRRSDLFLDEFSPILFGMKTINVLSQLNFVYRAKVKAVCNATDEFDGISVMSIDSSFNIQIEAVNCTNDEFAKRFFVLYGEGHLEGDGWLVLYVKSVDIGVGDEIKIPSDVAFNAMVERMVLQAEEELEQRYIDAIENINNELEGSD